MSEDLILYQNQEELEFVSEIMLPESLKNTLNGTEISKELFNHQDIKEFESDNIIDIQFEKSIDKADKWDYIAAASSGLMAALIDILWVGKYSLERAGAWGEKEVNNFVIEVAHKVGYKGDDLKDAIRKLEKTFPMATDKVKDDFGGGLHHHLRDFGHHPTIVGLVFSILTQFTGKGYGTNTNGDFIIVDILDNELMGKDIPEKLFNGVIVWAFHLISDMAGSSGNIGPGTGIPGPILSFLKELSSLPLIKDIKKKYKGKEIQLSVLISKLFNGTYFKEEGQQQGIKFDLRTEIGVAHEISRQALPVVVNECVVRAIYTLRRFYLELKSKKIRSIKGLNKLEGKNFLPFNNRAIKRMITVSSGVFMTIETSEAAIAAAVKSEGNAGAFTTEFLLSINYIGIGRFVFACVADGKYIAEDIKDVYVKYINKQKEKARKAAENTAGLKNLILTEKQAKFLNSLKLHKALYDVERTRNKKLAELKLQWLEEWKEITLEGLYIEDDNYYIYDEITLYREINHEADITADIGWLYLICIELSIFEPYYPLGSDNDKKYKRLGFKNIYDESVFCEKQFKITSATYTALHKSYNHFINVLTNKTMKTLTGIGIAAAVTAVTGGLAFVYAPQLAVLIAGGSLPGLYGIALTNASLATIGGGSLAVGGLGMAGGTAIITGGGALIGVTSSGLVSISASMLLSSKEFTLNECAKLLTYSRDVMVGKLHNAESVSELKKEFDIGMEKYKAQIQMMESGTQQNKEKKKLIKNCKQSLKYIEKCSNELAKLVE